jgi:HD domain
VLLQLSPGRHNYWQVAAPVVLPVRCPVVAEIAARKGEPTAHWAALEARRLLLPLGSRWSHVKGVVATARRLTHLLSEPERQVLVAAAYLHDIGWAPQLMETHFHPIDGARWVRRAGQERLATLVAHHSGARFEAELRGLTTELEEFEEERSATADALTYCDLVTGPDGEPVDVEQRWAGIRHRYGQSHVSVIALEHAKPALLTIVKRCEARLLAGG